VALFHLFTACDAFTKRDFVKMDAALAQSIRAWPDNPLAVYLTGEKLAATGAWEKAADSLEARAAGTEDQWIAQRLAQRARDLRDGKGSTKSLVLDAHFLVEFAARATAKTARNSSTGRKLSDWLDGAEAFGQALRSSVPFLGSAATTKSSEGK
jgi:thioredoxin-like negative regulator of GroEL